MGTEERRAEDAYFYGPATPTERPQVDWEGRARSAEAEAMALRSEVERLRDELERALLAAIPRKEGKP